MKTTTSGAAHIQTHSKMRKSIRARIATIAIVFISIASKSTIAKESQPEHFDFRPSPLRESLTQQIVNQTMQDKSGNIWFVTQEGLNKYNGHEIENYRYSLTNPKSLAHDSISAIAQDTAGRLWIGTKGGGLDQYDYINNNFKNIPANENSRNSILSNEITTIFSDKSGYVWIGYNNSFSRMDPEKLDFDHYKPVAENRLDLGEVTTFAEAPDGNIWVAGSNGGVYRIAQPTMQDRQLTIRPVDALDSVVATKILVSSKNEIWIATQDNGLLVYKAGDRTSLGPEKEIDFNSKINARHISDIYEDIDKNIWIATLEGLHLITPDTNKIRTFNSENSNLSASRTYSIYQSQEGKFWVGNILGLYSATRLIFSKYDSANSDLSNDSVNAFAETSGETLWVGTDDGLNWKSIENTEFKWINEFTEPSIPDPTVMSLLGDGDTLWVGTFSRGLIKLDLDQKNITIYRHNPSNKKSLPADGITAISKSNEGDILVGTYGGGLAILKKDSEEFIRFQNSPTTTNSLSSNKVIAIQQDSLGPVWVGTEDGLNKVDIHSGRVERIYSERGNTTSLSSDMVWAFHEDKNANLWLGTKGGGLNMLSRNNRIAGINKFEHFSENIALPSSNIYGIKSDTKGHIWISHNKGVSKIDPKLSVARHYGITDGLQDKEFNMGASYQSQSGEIYFGGNRGFNIIRPWKLPETERIPLVHISEIKIMNQRLKSDIPYDSLRSIDLDHTDRILSIEFFASDYTNPSLNKYAYKLEGVDENWIISNEARHVSFTTLPAGSYTLKLGAANPSGVWNWNGKSININVAPPPWRSPLAFLAYTLSALVLLLLLYLKSRRDKHQVIRRQQELERKVRERTVDLEEARKIAEKANSAKSQFLATVSHEIRTPMHGMLGMTDLLLRTELTEQQKSYAEIAKSNGESLLSIINDILDFSKIESGRMEIEEIDFNLVNLLEECCYLYAEAARKKRLNLTHEISKDIPESIIGDPGKIRQIVNNVLNNAIKFTDDGAVKLSAAVIDSRSHSNQIAIQICIADTGIGMDQEATNRAFQPFTQADSSTTRKYGGTGLGLSICKDLAELINGDIKIFSKKNMGTTVCLTAPLTSIDDKDKAKEDESRTPENHVTLISSDNSFFRMLTPQFERLGIFVTQAQSIDELDIEKSIICIDENLFLSDRSKLPETIYQNAILVKSSIEESQDSVTPNITLLSRPTTTKTLRYTLANIVGPKDPGDLSTHKKPPKRKAKILVAEDIETNQEIVKSIANILDYEITIVSDGLKAVDSWKSNDYDMIFMDCQMPILDGFSATRKIREIERGRNTPAEESITIIAITAGSAEEERHACLEAGMNGFLGKPFVVDQFQETVEKFAKTTKGTAPCSANSQITLQDVLRNKTESSDQHIDTSAINRIKALDPDGKSNLLQRVIETFYNQATETLQTLRGHSDAENVRRSAHALKSMALNVGATRFADLSGILESDSKSRQIFSMEDRLSELFFELENYMEEVKAHFL